MSLTTLELVLVGIVAAMSALAYLYALLIAQDSGRRGNLERKELIALKVACRRHAPSGSTKRADTVRMATKSRHYPHQHMAIEAVAISQGSIYDEMRDEMVFETQSPMKSESGSYSSSSADESLAPRHVSYDTRDLEKSEAQYRTRKLREFHRTIVAGGVALVLGTLAIMYIGIISNIVLLARASDGLEVNPWRWLIFMPFVTGLVHAFVSMTRRQTPMIILASAFQGGMSRVLLGFAILLAPLSTDFYGIVGVAIALAALAILLLWRQEKRTAKLRRRGIARFAMIMPLALSLAHFITFFASYEVAGWLNKEASTALFVVSDALLFILPAVYLLTPHYYKREAAWPLFPRIVYNAYGLDIFWKLESRPSLLDIRKAELQNPRS